MAKIDKVIEEIAKTKQKIADYQNRLKELEQQKTELENSEIVGIVRNNSLSASELNAIIKMVKEKQTIPLQKESALNKLEQEEK